MVRPEPQCWWAPRLSADTWDNADAQFDPSDEEDAGRWRMSGHGPPETWSLAWGDARFQALQEERAAFLETWAVLGKDQQARAQRLRQKFQKEREARRDLQEEIGEPGPGGSISPGARLLSGVAGAGGGFPGPAGRGKG